MAANAALTVPRPSTSDHQQIAVTVDEDGSLVVVEGTEGKLIFRKHTDPQVAPR